MQKKLHWSIYSAPDSAKKQQQQFTYGQTVQKNNKQFTYGQTSVKTDIIASLNVHANIEEITALELSCLILCLI